MKKLILALTLTAFAVAVQAGEGTCCSQAAGSCCSKTQTSVTKSECPVAKQAHARVHKSTKVVTTKVLQSPKAASQAG